jgi:hypothetical protein
MTFVYTPLRPLDDDFDIFENRMVEQSSSVTLNQPASSKD